MTLSRKHYVEIADILRAERDAADRDLETTQSYGRHDATLRVLDRIENHLCAYFRSDNPNFDPERFRKAAQP